MELTSSPAVRASTRSPRSAAPVRAVTRDRAMAAAIMAAMPPFMSAAPLPHTLPSASSPPKGSRVHGSAPGATVSRWAL